MATLLAHHQPARGELHPGATQTYLDLAGRLGARLGEMEGFVSIERFQSLTHPHKLLSLSMWRDEKAWAGSRCSPTTACGLLPCFATTGCATARKRRPTVAPRTGEHHVLDNADARLQLPCELRHGVAPQRRSLRGVAASIPASTVAHDGTSRRRGLPARA